VSRRSIVISSEGRSEVAYGQLPVEDLEHRMGEYERKYGWPLESFAIGVSCDTAGVHELSDLMDWESLVEEIKTRPRLDRVEARR